MTDKLYFRSTDHCFPETLQDTIIDAEIEELEEITVVEAIPDDGTRGIVWCHLYDVVEESECKKSRCCSYKSKSGRGRCENKGKLYLHGESVTIKINDNDR